MPDAPAGIKAVISSAKTVLVTWLPPAKVNGILTKYTLYMAVSSQGSRVSYLWIAVTFANALRAIILALFVISVTH